jgi:hypothetical protein
VDPGSGGITDDDLTGQVDQTVPRGGHMLQGT